MHEIESKAILDQVPTQETQSEAARSELERVLASPGFARNERLSRFLRFVVERRLEGKDSEIKESLLAIEVFRRAPDYDPKQDPIVRTEASRLRARLSEYYLGDGKDDPLVIELPKGGYVPAFRPGVAGRAPAAQDRRSPRRWLWAAAAVACVVILLAAAWWRLRRQNEPIPIAVLPLINFNQDPANDYFVDGLTGEIATCPLSTGWQYDLRPPLLPLKAGHRKHATPEDSWKPTTFWKAPSCALRIGCG